VTPCSFARPPAFCLLHAKIIPSVGGDTLWADCVTAYASLPLDFATWPTSCASCTATTAISPT
jgi:alpha-ketoglutarate-dependent taurine dioxygenase